jgi:hypothetical protein
MDTRWHAVLIESHLYVIRSWTGRCMFELKISNGSPYSVTEAWANRDKRQFQNRAVTRDIVVLSQAIDAILRAEER